MRKTKWTRCLLLASLVTGCSSVGGQVELSESQQGLTISPTAVYQIKSAASGKCINIAGNSTANSAKAEIRICNGAVGQNFTIASVAAGYYAIKNTNSLKCLDVNAKSTADGAAVIQYTCNSASTNQQWAIAEVSPGVVRLTAHHSGKVAEVNLGGTADGTAIVQRTWNGTTYQQFQLSTGTGGTGGAGGTTGTGGTTSTGGSTVTGGTTSTGGSTVTGGTTSTGGSTVTGGTTSTGGSTVTGGTTSTGGSTGTGGTTTPVGNIPAGYPTPTPLANYAACKSVGLNADGLCPGGGVGPACVECLLGGSTYTVANVDTTDGTAEAGTYAVTVVLGGAAAGLTQITTEANRGLLPVVATNPGQFLEYAFAVNVRAREGQPVQSTASTGYSGLDLFFSGPAATPPQISAIGYALTKSATKPVMVYLAGDSTVCDQTNTAFGGWGQMLAQHFAPPVGIANYADSGESSSSFYGNSRMWPAIKSHWTAGDWVIIQFGHNDKNVSDSVVQANLTKYVTDAQAAGVKAILVSPPARVNTVPIGDQSGLHAASAQAAATAKGVPYIDLTSLSTAWYNSLGTQSAALAYHANGTDVTHTNLAGADKLAGFVADAIKNQGISLAQYLR